jgi:spore coat polysaccharide biosynthesis protein SpsF (cytidylyltransferase family)
MKVVALVQVGMGSTRLPGKALRSIAGRSIIELLLARLSQSSELNEIIVATSKEKKNDQLQSVVESLGYKCTRGSEKDVLNRFYESAKFSDADVIVRIMGDCPLLDSTLVDKCVKGYKGSNVDYFSNINPTTYPNGLDIEVMSFESIERANKETNSSFDREHVTPYICNSDSFSKSSMQYTEDLSNQRWAVDEPEDLIVVTNIFEYFSPDIFFNWEQVLELRGLQPALFAENQYTKNNNDFSGYDTVFCDSLQALEWAYKHKLPKSAIVKTGAPAILSSNKKNIHNIEERWSANELKKFQSTMQKLTIDSFDASLSIPGIERELALIVSRCTYNFQKILYKAACLDKSDFINPRLFIHVSGETGPLGNMMNSPWDELLSVNPLFSTINYTLEDDNWSVLTTQGVPYLRRFAIAGYETLIYRLSISIMKKLPSFMFSKEIFMPNENELNIEIAYSLALRGVKISSIQLDNPPNIKNTVLDENLKALYCVILPIMREKVEQWAEPTAVEVVMNLFKSTLKHQVQNFTLLANRWENVIANNIVKKRKLAVLMNASGSVKGQALSYACRKNGIPLLSSQHGVTVEISKVHDIVQFAFDNAGSDAIFSYNNKIVDIESNSYFDKSEHYVAGMPMRLIRMKYTGLMGKPIFPIVYISSLLYSNGLSLSQKTDYIKAIDERLMITKVLNKLPHDVCYKTYPADNRRYADTDPVLSDIYKSNNIHLFANKVDFRYLISRYDVLVCSHATSTLGWVIMSKKPTVFIDHENDHPLTDDAHTSFSKGIFVFNSNEKDFHKKLRIFLSQPIEVIKQLWDDKKNSRNDMIKEYFSEYSDGAGKRSAQIILKKYLT